MPNEYVQMSIMYIIVAPFLTKFNKLTVDGLWSFVQTLGKKVRLEDLDMFVFDLASSEYTVFDFFFRRALLLRKNKYHHNI